MHTLYKVSLGNEVTKNEGISNNPRNSGETSDQIKSNITVYLTIVVCNTYIAAETGAEIFFHITNNNNHCDN